MNRSVKLLSYRTLRLVCICIAIVIASACLAVFSVSLSIKAKTASSILSAESIGAILDVDCIIVLGAGLRSDGSPSDMLADRLSVGISLLEKHPDAVLLLTGDNSGDQYNEVAAMKTYALEHGVDEAKIIEDDFGFSTYESIYRAKNTFNVDKAVIVSL